MGDIDWSTFPARPRKRRPDDYYTETIVLRLRSDLARPCPKCGARLQPYNDGKWPHHPGTVNQCDKAETLLTSAEEVIEWNEADTDPPPPIVKHTDRGRE